MRSRLALLVLLVATLSACDSTDPAASIGGLYVHTEGSGDVTGRLTLDIPDTERGTFTLGSRSEMALTSGSTTLTTTLTGAGRYDHPSLTLDLVIGEGTDEEEETLALNGTVSESRDTITLRDDEGSTVLTFTRP